MFLLQQQAVFLIEVYQHTDLGAQNVGIYRLENVVDRPRLISFENILVAVIIRCYEYDGDMLELFALVNQRSCFEAVKIRHLHIHQDHGKVELV